MSGMFIADSALKWLNVSSFETPNVNDVNGMFAGASSLKMLNLAKLDLTNVTQRASMSDMFDQTTGLIRLIFRTQSSILLKC